jgi:mono/diheme cytochrome c family protein
MKRRVASGLLWAAAAFFAVAAVVAATGGDEPPAPRAAAAGTTDRGALVWAANACGGCHTLDAAGSSSPIGPDLDQALKGETDEFIRESIVAPDARIAAGFSAGMMPGDFAKRISPQDLTALVAWLARSTGARTD